MRILLTVVFGSVLDGIVLTEVMELVVPIETSVVSAVSQELRHFSEHYNFTQRKFAFISISHTVLP